MSLNTKQLEAKAELEKACEPPYPEKHPFYWTSEIYGMGNVYREYGFYPKSWPLNIYTSHGVALAENPPAHELESKAPLMFYFSNRLAKKFKKISNKRCYTIISPFIYYRRKHKIKQNKNANGTLVFVGHSTPNIDDISDVSQYIKQLNEIPKEFHPLTICLHFHDINKGMHINYLKAGFDVKTVGNSLHPDFMIRFYSLLKNYKYVTSNMIGSYASYAVEMNIPFFLYGNEPILFNKKDKNIEKGLYKSFNNYSQVQIAKTLFANPSKKVSIEQKEFVEEQLGINYSVSRLKFSFLLYSSYLHYKILTYKGPTIIKKVLGKIDSLFYKSH